MIIDQTTIIQYRESIMLMTMFHVSVSRVIAYSIFLATSLVLAMMGRVHGFPQIDPSLPRRCRSQPPLLGFFQRPPCCCTRNVQLIRIFNAYNNFDESIGQERDDEDDDEYLNVDMLGDWRAFRRNLAASKLSSSSKSEENEALLKTQCEDLAREYVAEVWAHTAPMPEVGGLIVRMPLESEIFHNHKHCLTGRRLRSRFNLSGQESPRVWFKCARQLIENDMVKISDQAGSDGQIDPLLLGEEATELLQLYVDNQETWQEVCLVLDHDDATKASTAVVLNRPMGLKLTERLAQHVLCGSSEPTLQEKAAIFNFMMAFGSECAVYIGGMDEQERPAKILHGIADLPGAVEIVPGSRIFCGGIDSAVQGVLQGKYKPMDFRFFVGRHLYDESNPLDLSILLGKYQPVACARSLILKQCISLPKPLWHEVLELCGSEMKELSILEFAKRDEMRFKQ